MNRFNRNLVMHPTAERAASATGVRYQGYDGPRRFVVSSIYGSVRFEQAVPYQAAAAVKPKSAGCVIILNNWRQCRRGGLIGSRIHQPDKFAGAVTATLPNTSAEREAIREQLQRILACPLFRNSKRYTNLLRYSVEQRLDGSLDCLKERSIGVEVFGRHPDYNTTSDPVVRTSAVEVRKRLAEYYQQPGHGDELRIELPAGCYIPEFRAPEAGAATAELLEQAPTHVQNRATAELPAARPNVRKPAAAVAALVLLMAGLLWKPWQAPDALDQFWRPVWQASSPVLFSVTGLPGATSITANPGASNGEGVGDLLRSGRDAVPLPDVTALVNIASYLRSKGKMYRIRMSRDIEFQDLRSGPVVVIGPVTRRQELLGAGLRFNVERDEARTETWISDRDHPQSRNWLVQVNAPANTTADVYALVTRAWNDTTGQVTVLIAGLSTYATTAAGEFLSDARQMQQLAALAPRGWERKNIQLVISAKRVGTSAGKPRVVAVYAW